MIDGLLLEGSVFEELAEGGEGWVDVCQPEEEELFEGCFTIGQAVGCAVEPLGCGEIAAVDGYVGKLDGEGEEEAFDLGGAGMAGEPAYGFGEDCGVYFFAITGDHRVVELIDQAHGEESAGVDDSCWISLLGAQILELFCQLSACSDVGEDDVAGVVEEQIVQVQFFSESAGDMKFHAGFLVQNASSRSNPNGPDLCCLEKNDGHKDWPVSSEASCDEMDASPTVWNKDDRLAYVSQPAHVTGSEFSVRMIRAR
ncbi:hypothetical protein RBB78_14600 [Tunturiibacter empetritectus]|uniref:hypothetical protein n=1 Tax=Tunturiibacter empetritectus TaxID=3069691 RepID=UPI003D9B94BC